MLQLLSDENFDGNIVRGLVRRIPDLDLLRVQDVGLGGVDDPVILEWAASQDRILLTHDRGTMPAFAFERVRSGGPMSGVFVIDDQLAIGQAIAELQLVVSCSEQSEWNGLVTFFPL